MNTKGKEVDIVAFITNTALPTINYCDIYCSNGL